MTVRASPIGRGVGTVLLLALALTLSGCSSLTIPRLERPPQDRRLVVVVPGITGVELVDPVAQRTVWGRSGSLLCPRDGGYRLAQPGLLPGDAIRRLRIGPLVKPIYAPIERLFVDNGWSVGDLDEPAEGGDLFFFAYDWRRGNVESARLLARRLEALAVARGREVAVSLVCQSNGALICRYLAKYGGATLEEAESGATDEIAGVRLQQLVLVGTANGGSIRILRFLNRGRRYVPLVGRTFRPELFATFDSLFQDLPVYADDLFLDATGEALEIDLFDPSTWERYGWSIHHRAAVRRLGRSRAAEVFPPADERRRRLAAKLLRARRFRQLLDRELDVGEVRYYSIQNDRIPTAARAVLRSTADGWETLFLGDRQLDGRLAARVVADGDGHATVVSQRWLSESETDAFAEPTHRVDGPHFEMILEPEAMRRLLAICARPRQPRVAAAPPRPLPRPIEAR